MVRARIALVALAAFSFVGARPDLPQTAHAGSLRLVRAGTVAALVPTGWDVRPLPTASPLVTGVQAAPDLERWSTTPTLGVQAYWVDATGLGVPSDYYREIARGPALTSLTATPGCRAEDRTVWTDPNGGPTTGHYFATLTGTCDRGHSRWGAFVAAPGFTAARALGIPRSGLYVAFASIRESTDADQRLRRLVMNVTFGDTRVRELLNAVGATAGVL